MLLLRTLSSRCRIPKQFISDEPFQNPISFVFWAVRPLLSLAFETAPAGSRDGYGLSPEVVYLKGFFAAIENTLIAGNAIQGILDIDP